MMYRVRPTRSVYTRLATIDEISEEGVERESPPPAPPPPSRPRSTISVTPAPLQARRAARLSRGLLPSTRDKAQNNEDQAQQQSLRHASSNRAPGVGGEELGSLGGGDVSTYRWHYEASIASRGGGDGTTLQGDRFSLSVNQPLFHRGDATFLAGATAARDSLSFNLSDLLPGKGSSGAVFTLRPNYVSLGGAGALHFANGDTLGGSLAASVRCDSGLRLLERRGDLAQLEQKVQHTVGPQLTAGVGVGAVGMGARFTAVSRREVTYRSWRSLADASTLLLEDSKCESWRDGIKNWLRHKVQGAGLQSTPMQLPDLTRLDAAGLRVGDEIVMTVTPKTGFITGGLALALGGVLVGGYYAFHREVLLAVRRDENNSIDVAVTRRLTHSCTLGVDVPIVADAHHTRVTVNAVADLFRFDLAEAAAAFAYLRLWQQQALPEGSANHPERLDNLADIAAALRLEHFEPGISRLGFELLTIPGKTVRAAGASSPWYLPPLRQPGWNLETHNGVEEYLEFTRRSSLLTRRLEFERRSERPSHREHRAAAYAIQSNYLPAVPALQNVEEALVLGARFGYERFSSKERLHLVDVLNKKYSLKMWLTTSTHAAHQRSRRWSSAPTGLMTCKILLPPLWTKQCLPLRVLHRKQCSICRASLPPRNHGETVATPCAPS